MVTLDPYQGVLLVSFGGPESPQEVAPFLRSVTAGRGIPDERLAEVGTHYYERGGRSPINDENRALRAALVAELARRGVDVPVIWGNRHLEPSLPTALQQAVEQGIRRAVVVLTSAYPSYSGCRQYREDVAAALAQFPAPERPELDKLAPYAGHPGFAATMAELTARTTAELAAVSSLPAQRIALVFVTHSIPVEADARSGPPGGGGQAYTRWHSRLSEAIAKYVSQQPGADGGPISPTGWLRHDLVYCSRSGPPNQPWLEPDISDHLQVLAGEGIAGVVVVPLGFVSDHMEVVYDLDDVAAQTADRLGLAFRRVPTVRTQPQFVAGLVDQLIARAERARGGQVATPGAPRRPDQTIVDDSLADDLRFPDECAVGCCPNPRGPRPAACGQEG